ncbi:protein FAM210B, mitochondrial [Ambystoma mexicanum]|uniref:protein FAM210B, mitochondrial n=1 Tax=Ambystoma mexicanum TaxID=8296 RepID=UPI0037E8CFF5
MHGLLVPRSIVTQGWAGLYNSGNWLLLGHMGRHSIGCRGPLRPFHGAICPGGESRKCRLAALAPTPPPASTLLVASRCFSAPGGSPAPEKESVASAGKEAAAPAEDGKKLNKSQQLKKVFKEYGAVGVSFHVGISLMSLGIFYVIVSSGVDITAILLKVGFSETVVQSKMAAGTSTFVLAYAIHKLFAPVRMSITVVSVPFIVRYFRKIGFFKHPTAKG